MIEILDLDIDLSYEIYNDTKDILKAGKCYENCLDILVERYILNPIYVDGKGFIHDGQHRYQACKELGIPIYFIVDETLDSEAMEILNNNETKSHWTHEDFLEKYIKENKKDYITFNKIIKKYKLNFSDLMHIICELSDFESIGEREALVQFDEGNFVLDCYDETISFLDELSLFDEYEWSRHTSFVRALFRLYTEEFYDGEYMRKRVEVNEIELRSGRRSTIIEYGKYIADVLYSDTKRGVSVIFYEDGRFYNIGKRGRKKKAI